MAEEIQPGEAAMYNGSKIIIGMPVMYHVEPETHISLLMAANNYGRDRLKWMWEGRTCIWEARNRLAHRFLQTDAEYLIQVDSDMAFPCGNAAWFQRVTRNQIPKWQAEMNFLDHLMSFPKDVGIVGGAYYDRKVGRDLQCSDGHHKPGFSDDYRNGRVRGLLEQTWVATGCLRIARWVFEKIKAEASNQFPEMVPADKDRRWGYFTPFTVIQGEDVAFAHRAKYCGIKSYLAADLRIMHKGERFL